MPPVAAASTEFRASDCVVRRKRERKCKEKARERDVESCASTHWLPGNQIKKAPRAARRGWKSQASTLATLKGGTKEVCGAEKMKREAGGRDEREAKMPREVGLRFFEFEICGPPGRENGESWWGKLAMQMTGREVKLWLCYICVYSF